MDAIVEAAGFVNVHRYYPHRVIGHRLGRIQVGALHRLRWLGFGLPTYVSLTEPHLAVEGVPRSGSSRRCGTTAASATIRCAKAWAVEPHIATPDQRLGSKWEEILVVTPTAPTG